MWPRSATTCAPPTPTPSSRSWQATMTPSDLSTACPSSTGASAGTPDTATVCCAAKLSPTTPTTSSRRPARSALNSGTPSSASTAQPSSFAGVLSRISFRRAELADPGSSSAEPLRKKMLLHKHTAHPSDITVDIERLAAVPDDKAEHIAQAVRVLGSHMALPESATATLRAVKSARALASAVKTVWLASPTAIRLSLQSFFLDLINTVEGQHRSTGLEDQRLAALRTLDPLIDAATAPGRGMVHSGRHPPRGAPYRRTGRSRGRIHLRPRPHNLPLSRLLHRSDHPPPPRPRPPRGGDPAHPGADVQLSSHICPVRAAYHVRCPRRELLRPAATFPGSAPAAGTPPPGYGPPAIHRSPPAHPRAPATSGLHVRHPARTRCPTAGGHAHPPPRHPRHHPGGGHTRERALCGNAGPRLPNSIRGILHPHIRRPHAPIPHNYRLPHCRRRAVLPSRLPGAPPPPRSRRVPRSPS